MALLKTSSMLADMHLQIPCDTDQKYIWFHFRYQLAISASQNCPNRCTQTWIHHWSDPDSSNTSEHWSSNNLSINYSLNIPLGFLRGKHYRKATFILVTDVGQFILISTLRCWWRFPRVEYLTNARKSRQHNDSVMNILKPSCQFHKVTVTAVLLMHKLFSSVGTQRWPWYLKMPYWSHSISKCLESSSFLRLCSIIFKSSIVIFGNCAKMSRSGHSY